MNTPAHLILGAAAFGRPDANKITAAALLGAFLPDFSLYLMAGVSIFVLGIPGQIVFDEMYFSDAWQQVFAIDNSFVLWGLLLAAGIWSKKPWLIALCGAALLHIALDFPLHNEDARMHFWPITDWKFYSPYSYWDSRSGANVIAVLEMILVIACTIWLFFRFSGWGWKALFGCLALLQVAPVIVWAAFF